MKLNPNILNLRPVLIIALSLSLLLLPSCVPEPANQALYDKALKNGKSANEGLRRCGAYLDAWLEYADPATGLIPENLAAGIDRWTPHNSAADNYPFMVLVSALTDSARFHGTMHRMLERETALT